MFGPQPCLPHPPYVLFTPVFTPHCACAHITPQTRAPQSHLVTAQHMDCSGTAPKWAKRCGGLLLPAGSSSLTVLVPVDNSGVHSRATTVRRARAMCVRAKPYSSTWTALAHICGILLYMYICKHVFLSDMSARRGIGRVAAQCTSTRETAARHTGARASTQIDAS